MKRKMEKRNKGRKMKTKKVTDSGTAEQCDGERIRFYKQRLDTQNQIC